MDSLRVSITKIFKDAIKSFYRFPASIISAIVICIVAIIRIDMGWQGQQPYNFLFDSIQISFVLGAVFSMGLVVMDEIKPKKDKSSYLLSNAYGILVAIISFLLLYFFGGKVSTNATKYLSNIASARMGVAIFVSSVMYVYMISKSKIIDSFGDSFFITHRAFAISALYGLVIMIGVSGVLGAFQSLIYRNMSYEVYQYLGVIVGFLTYTIFLGYFPSFTGLGDAKQAEEMKAQPKFIYVLFGYILVPIMTALTLVLLIWSARVIFTGMNVPFNQLSGIASSYVVVGIWLHIMVAKHDSKLAGFYRKAYPFSAILVLGFEAWALVVQLSKYGLQTTEYSFLMIWIFALISVFLLIFLKDQGYRKIALVAIVISMIAVLPFIGYYDLTFNSQVNRLENLLVGEGLLENGGIIKADREIDHIKKSEITNVVDFITYSDKSNVPNWFKEKLNDNKVFKETFGFEKAYGIDPDEKDYTSTTLILQAESIDISEYELSLNLKGNDKAEMVANFRGKNGNYEISWANDYDKAPKIILKLEGKVIIERDLEEYLTQMLLDYPAEGDRSQEVPLEDMGVKLEAEGISILLVFDNVNIYLDKRQDRKDYHTNIQGLYVNYK